ncbi:MAG: YfhO family protein, partial [Clostridia bacterium]|nr:YfhO family protein [Clostridia bacterium]
MSSENISVETNHLPQTTGSNSSSNDSIDKSIRNKSVVKKSSSKHLIWAFLLPFGIMLSIYAALGTYPFGESSVLVLDLNGQYVYFFEALRDFVWGEGSLFYSFSRAMGGEFLGMYAYYLASPLSY